MGKGKDKALNKGASVPTNVDAHLRMNFLFQASLQQHAASSPSLSRYYNGLIRSIAERTVLRLYDKCSKARFTFFRTLLTVFTFS